MKNSEILHYRLLNQQIAGTNYHLPEEIVNHLVAMQAQEFAMAKWSIGLRLPGSTDALIQKTFDDGSILRTHLMRPTWHFVTPADIRWLLKLTAPRVQAINAFTYRQMDVDAKLFKRTNDLFEKKLAGGNHLTRTELQAALKAKNIVADGIRLACILMQAELDGIICSGPRLGKQFTYALLEERVAPAPALSRRETLVNFTQRYFASRGPATAEDFSYWSGLTMKDCKDGIASLPSNFLRQKNGKQEYIYLPIETATVTKNKSSFLMPDYDEYGMSYKDRAILADPKHPHGKIPYNRMIVINGRMLGCWKRTQTGNSIRMETIPFNSFNKSETELVRKAVNKYLAFNINET